MLQSLFTASMEATALMAGILWDGVGVSECAQEALDVTPVLQGIQAVPDQLLQCIQSAFLQVACGGEAGCQGSEGWHGSWTCQVASQVRHGGFMMLHLRRAAFVCEACSSAKSW